MKVMHVIHVMDRGGQEKLVYDFMTRGAGTIEPMVCCLDSVGELGDALRAQGYEVVCLGREPGIDRALVRKLADLMNEKRINVAHAHSYTPYFYAATAAALGARAKVIFTEHGRFYPDHLSLKRVLYNQFLIRHTAQVTAVAGYIRESLARFELIPRRRVKVIYNGIDPERFDNGVNVAEVRRELRLSAKHKVIGTAARFDPIKDHATLLRAFAKVAGQEPDARLLLVGDGPQRPETEALARELGLNGDVIFCGMRDDVPRMLAAMDVFVLSSLSEGASVTLLEAMAARKPCVVTRVGGNPELVESGRTGLLSHRGEADELARKLLWLLDHSARGAEMGEAGRERVLQHFTLARMFSDFEQLYGEVLKNAA